MKSARNAQFIQVYRHGFLNQNPARDLPLLSSRETQPTPGRESRTKEDKSMPLILWLLGVPLGLVVILWLMGIV